MRLSFFSFLTLTILLAACGGGSNGRGADRNILLVVLDAARADHFSSYGYSRPTTPNLDRIAGEGARFTMAFSSSSWTLPAHASLFTGLPPDEHKTNAGHAWLIERIPTLAELLSKQGYRTAAFSNNPFVDRAQNLHRGFRRFEAVWADSIATDSLRPYNTPHTNRLVESFIDSCTAGGERFFAFINYMDTHMPYNPPEPYHSMYLGDNRVPAPRLDSLCRYAELLNDGDLAPDSSERAAMVDVYDGALTYLDSQVGELLEHLRRSGILDSTLVIILSDHGEVFGEAGHFTHGVLLSRPLVQIALILRDPELIAQPVVRREPVSITDIFHSLVTLTGALEQQTADSRGRYLFGGEIEPASCYSKLFTGREAVQSRSGGELSSLVTPAGRHFIHSPESVWECYDLARDFDEQANLVPSRVSRGAVEQALAEYEQTLTPLVETREDLAIRDTIRLEHNQVEAMRALGYVGAAAAAAGDMHPHTLEHFTASSRAYLLGDYTSAEREIRAALALETDNLKVRQQLGFTLYRQDRLEGAVAVLGSLAGAGDGDSPLVRNVLAAALEGLGRGDEALREYLAACALAPGDIAVVPRTAGLLLKAGRDSAADSLLAGMIAHHENEADALDAAGAVYLAAGRWQSAEKSIKRAIRFGRTAPRLNNLALCALKQNNKAEARRLLVELLGMDLDNQQRRNYQLQLDALANNRGGM